MFNMLVEKG